MTFCSRCWTIAIVLLLAALSASAQVEVQQDTTSRQPGQLFSRPQPDTINQDDLLRRRNANPAVNPFADTTRLGRQPDSLKEAGRDRVQPNREGGVPADSGKLRWPVPGRAARWSLILPGAGQVYNRQIWKVPLVYAALGTTVYFYQYWNREYLRLKDAYEVRVARAALPEDQRDNFRPGYADPAPRASDERIRNARDQYRRYRDYNAFFFILAYSLNAVEAYVAAHLKHFTVSDDLSLHIEPSTIRPPSGAMPYGYADGGASLFPMLALQVRLSID